MTHTYKITGMTCGNCESKVKSSLLKLPGITEVELSKESQSARITMERHIPLSTMQQALDPKYKLTALDHHEPAEQVKSWLVTYQPILLIFAYISAVAILVAGKNGAWNGYQAMNIFMAGFFLSFSFFKMLDLKGFAESYGMYDIIARKFPFWGYLYPFIELALGIAFAVNFQPYATNLVTLLLMGISIIGVLQTVLNKRKIRCACLGAVFNLPMSTVTIIEDGLMILMSGLMLTTLH